MISSIIDILIDISNTFGSLIRSIALKLKDYNSLLISTNRCTTVDLQTLFQQFPQINKELSLCKHSVKYILITNTSNKNKIAYNVILLSSEAKLVHSFNILKKVSDISITLPSTCYWEL